MVHFVCLLNMEKNEKFLNSLEQFFYSFNIRRYWKARVKSLLKEWKRVRNWVLQMCFHSFARGYRQNFSLYSWTRFLWVLLVILTNIFPVFMQYLFCNHFSSAIMLLSLNVSLFYEICMMNWQRILFLLSYSNLVFTVFIVLFCLQKANSFLYQTACLQTSVNCSTHEDFRKRYRETEDTLIRTYI